MLKTIRPAIIWPPSTLFDSILLSEINSAQQDGSIKPTLNWLPPELGVWGLRTCSKVFRARKRANSYQYPHICLTLPCLDLNHLIPLYYDYITSFHTSRFRRYSDLLFSVQKRSLQTLDTPKFGRTEFSGTS